MTELLHGQVSIRLDSEGRLQSLRTPWGWRALEQVTNRWRVETGWWGAPIRRDYLRCLLSDGECLELYRDLDTGNWHLARRYD